MPEILGNRYEGQENRNNESISVFDDNKYQKELQSFYMRNQDNSEIIQSLKSFLNHQEQEKLDLREKLESLVLKETREELDKQAMINEAKIMLYEKLGIDNNLNNNSSFENFSKGIVDELILNNYDLAIQVWETNGKIILDGLSQLVSWDGLKQIAEAIGESFWSLLTGDAYEKGKAVAELGLIGSGVGVGVYVGKKTVKLGMKQISKLRINKERLVQSLEVKNVVGETSGKVDEIVPKKVFDFESKLVDNLPEEQLKELQKLKDKEVLDNRLNLKDFDNLSVDEKLKNLGIPKEFYYLINESGLGGKGFDVIKRYRALQYRDELLGKQHINFSSMIDKAIEKIPNLDRTEAMLIFAFTDKFMFGNINGVLRGTEKLTIAQKKLLKKLDEGLEKMPDLEGKHIIRGDSHHSWVSENEVKIGDKVATNVEISELIKQGKIKGLKKGDNILLDGYTFVSDNIDDIFIGKHFADNDTLVIIKGDNGGIKDISSLSLYKNFGDYFPGNGSTEIEGVIQRGSTLEFENSRILEKAKFNNGKFEKKVLVVRVKK
ncbi:hypothetical protein CSA08_04520 [Candidatus Gracilibacteria bacterium]|nr:MAG: hypothetical protein CSA08_04520 [Candidatus Gracilibacteria bacterium]